MNKDFERLIRENGPLLKRMAMNNGALLTEYRNCIVQITLRTAQRMEVPEKYTKSVEELESEIVRRMNGGD